MAGEVLRDVELFASGVYRGKPYSPADIDHIAGNARKLAPLGLDPPAVRGHEEDSAAPERTDVPADGWVDPNTVRAAWKVAPDGGRQRVLIGTITDVPPAMAEMIRRKRYRKVSAEIYDDFRDDQGRSHGKALRRVAYLGGEVPQVKGIGDLPAPTRFAERVRLVPGGLRQTAAGTFICFSEVRPMTRDENKAAVMAAMPGLQPATIDAMSDDQLADLAKNCGEKAKDADKAGTVDQMADVPREEMVAALVELGEGTAEELDALPDEELKARYDSVFGDPTADAAADPNAPPAQPATDFGDPATMTRDDLLAELEAMGQDPAALQAATDDDLKALYAQLAGGGPAAATPPATAMGERGGKGKPMATKFAERATRIAKATLAQALKTHKDAKRQDAEAFCEKLVREGRLLPVHRDVFLRDLMREDHVQAVRKFGETGPARTAFERRKAELGQLPVVLRFGERVTQKMDAATTAEAEVAKVRQFAETQATALQKAGYATPEQFVEKFSELQKKKPTLTAAQYIG